MFPRLKIAGLNPSKNLINLINNGHGKDIELISNPDDKTLDNLISNAQINISITAQKTAEAECEDDLTSLLQGQKINFDSARARN